MKAEQLIFYRDAGEHGLLYSMCRLMERRIAGVSQKLNDAEEQEYFSCVAQLYEYASENGFYGNLWHCYLTELLVYNENPYTIACEMRGEVQGSLRQAVLHDLRLFMEFFKYNLYKLDTVFKTDSLVKAMHYEASQKKAIKYNRHISAEICALAVRLAGAADAEAFRRELDEFYGKYGVGVFGLHKAFRVEHTRECLQINPIYNIAVTGLDDIIGYEIPKKKLIDNTEAFLQGQKANNCLIFGDAGTGKSSSIRAILNQYYGRGLRMIEVYKHQYQELNDLIDRLKCRNYKFIIYMDDLSFEEFETEYKYLKAVIEGGLESKPDNVLIYATSNRRHLIRENFTDKDGDGGDIHKNETVQEKLSLFGRFGVSIYFGAPNKTEFQEIVLGLAKKYGLRMPEEQLLAEANKWELSHGGLSGRCARQFIDAMWGQESI